MSRSLPEWIGKTDDARIPPRVRARVFAAHGGRCHLSGRQIRAGDAWDCDHVVALINGGEHRESNMQLTTSSWPWPFASVDSTDVGQNHNRLTARPGPLGEVVSLQLGARIMADRWDAAQCPPVWRHRAPHPELFAGAIS